MISKSAIIYTEDTPLNLTVLDLSIIYKDVVLGSNVRIGEHCVIGRNPTPTRAMVGGYSDFSKVVIGNDVAITAGVIIYGDVEIGDDSLIGDHVSIMSRVKIGKKVLLSRNVTINSDVIIKDNTRIMDNSHITGRSQIGSNVFISVGVSMANDNSFGKFGLNEDVKGATIGNYVSIGPGSIILPNVKIGEGSIIAAGSVVKNDIPPGMIASGNPAIVVCKVPKYMQRNK